jgi:hypothetical protein
MNSNAAGCDRGNNRRTDMGYGEGQAGLAAQQQRQQLQHEKFASVGMAGIPVQLDRPKTEIESSMGDLTNAICDLEAHVEKMRGRLAPALMPVGGTEAVQRAATPQPVRSSLATAINEQAERVLEVRRSVTDLLLRLAL